MGNIFHMQHDSDKTPNKDGYNKKDFFSNSSEATNNLVASSSYHKGINRACVRNKFQFLGRSYLRMTQHNIYMVSLSGEPQFYLCHYL